MIFNSFKDVVDMPILPHSLKRNKLKTNEISGKIKKELKEFLVDICRKIENITLDADFDEEFKNYSKRFIKIQNHIKEEIPDKKGNMRVSPAEYVEVIYIVTFMFNKYLGFTQEKVANILGISAKSYRYNWGISPVSDCLAVNMSYKYTLPIDDTTWGDNIIKEIGMIIANTSSSYFLGVSNNLSIFANIVNSNKSSNRGDFCGRQFICNPRKIDDLHHLIFIRNISNNQLGVKQKISHLIDTSDVVLGRELLEYLIKRDTDSKSFKLFQESNITKFQFEYDQYKDLIANKKLWEDARDDEDFHSSYDVFTVELKDLKEGKSIDAEAMSKAEIESMENDMSIIASNLIEAIDFSCFIENENLDVLSYIVDRYQRELYSAQAEIYKDESILSAKYFVIKYFEHRDITSNSKQNGVSKEALSSFLEYIRSGKLGIYSTKFAHDKVECFRDGKDIEDSTTLLDKLLKIKEQIENKKENRVVTCAMVYIDNDTFPVNDNYIKELTDAVENNFSFLVSSSSRLRLTDFKEKSFNSNNGTLYLYTLGGQV